MTTRACAVPKRLFDHTEGEGNPYNGKWGSELYARDTYYVTVECSFEHNMDDSVVILFDMRDNHIGYLGALWTTDEFENDGLYLYVVETESGQAETFEDYAPAIRWLQERH